jgi:arylsulfatase A-like enzyme
MSKPSLFRPFAFYAALAFLAGSLAPAVTAAAATKPSQPNIIFILCDDLGFGDIGVFWQNQRASAGDRTQPHFATPQIDTMARDGAMLTQHYCAAPVCAPSRASFLTGLTQGHANVRDNQFDQLLADTHTVGSVLQAAGYATAAFGKWGLQGGGEKNRDPDPARSMTERRAEYQTWDSYPTLRGFDYFYGYVRHRDGHFHYPKEEGREVWENDREVSAGLDGCYTTDLFTARAKQWIIDQHKAKPDQPFFTYLAFDTPHAVLQNPATAYPAGGGLKGGLKWTGKPGAMINTADGEMDAWMHPDLASQTWDHDGDPQSAEIAWPDVQKRYANGVRRIDDAVGDVLQLLSDLGIAENTLVVFTSDNGPSRESYLKEDYDPVFFDGFGPFDGIKRDTMEGGMREPTLVRWPARISGGKVENTPSGHWDWLATFADVAGVAPLAAVDGVSLTPLLTGLGSRSAGVIYTEYLNNGSTPNYEEFLPQHRGRKRGQMQALILDGYKGLRYNVQSADDDFEIFDLATDPQEGHNLAGTGKFIALQAKMKARVLQMRRPLESAARPYDVALTPALRVEPKGAAGLAWSRYDGTWPWMPEFRFLQASETGVSSMMGNSLPGASDKPFGLAYTGFVKVPADGTYTLSVASQNTVTVFMHDSRVIDEPIRGATGAVKESIHLAAGWHPIRVYYRHQTGQSGFEILLRDAQSNVINLDQRSLRQ